MASELRRRAQVHDRSKLSEEEFDGFVKISQVAREHAFGTPKYMASLQNGAVQRHYANNSHHPEHHERPEYMGWLDIIEMVIDWRVSSRSYGDGDFKRVLEVQKTRHLFNDEQWWRIKQVDGWLQDVENHGESSEDRPTVLPLPRDGLGNLPQTTV